MKMRAVVYAHEPHLGLGLLEKPLVDEGFTLIRRFRDVHHHDDLSAELIITLGGAMRVDDVAQHPFLTDEVGLIAERLAAGRAVLGIGLGAQILAKAAGADVVRGKNGIEVGAAPVKWLKTTDAVTSALGAKTVVAHWHDDTFSAVPGATLLASTDRYTQQAFHVGASYGFQFHFELAANDYAAWLREGAEELELLHEKKLSELEASVSKLAGAESSLVELRARLAHHFARVARGEA